MLRDKGAYPNTEAVIDYTGELDHVHVDVESVRSKEARLSSEYKGHSLVVGRNTAWPLQRHVQKVAIFSRCFACVIQLA